jgi:hypothetical protein
MLITLNWNLYRCTSVSYREPPSCRTIHTSQKDCCTLECTLWHVFPRVIIQSSLQSTWRSHSPTWGRLKRLHCNERVENTRRKSWILTQSLSAKRNPNNVLNTAVFAPSLYPQNSSQLATFRNRTQILFRIEGAVLKDLMSMFRIREVAGSNTTL